MKRLICLLLLALKINLVNSQTSEDYFSEAVTQYIERDFGTSLIFCDSAINNTPTYTTAYYLKAKIKSEIEKYYEAISDYSVFFSSKSNFVDVYTARAYCKSKTNDFNGAISDYDFALTLLPNSIVIHTSQQT